MEIAEAGVLTADCEKSKAALRDCFDTCWPSETNAFISFFGLYFFFPMSNLVNMDNFFPISSIDIDPL